MRIWRRQRPAGDDDATDDVSLAELEDNPELLAAEEAVDRLPPPPPSSSPFLDVVMGPRPRIVGLDVGEDPPHP
ncbi:MAG TPA: hypothetical protein VED84_08500 [Acidimicrobiales bacterium]|nr:hypothetical protein [Acidimicrobiales bacterium]